MLVRSPGWTHLAVAYGAPKDAVAKKPLWGFWLCDILAYMPRPKKQASELPVAQEKQAGTPFYAGMSATIIRTHEGGYIDLTVSYNGETQVQKNRVSPESIEYKNAP